VGIGAEIVGCDGRGKGFVGVVELELCLCYVAWSAFVE
jgi:hypothetical protein